MSHHFWCLDSENTFLDLKACFEQICILSLDFVNFALKVAFYQNPYLNGAAGLSKKNPIYTYIDNPELVWLFTTPSSQHLPHLNGPGPIAERKNSLNMLQVGEGEDLWAECF